MEGLVAGMVRARSARNQLRERGKTKSGSQSSVSTVASTTKSTKAKGPKEERGGKKGRSERSSARDGNPTRGTSPRPSAPRQARASQRLSSGTAVSGGGAGTASGVGGGAGASAAAAAAGVDTARESVSRRASAGTSVRLSSRKR
ncbi:unnamed protein product [Ectocarpus fasciculatus]